jgi:hypothetical protein
MSIFLNSNISQKIWPTIRGTVLAIYTVIFTPKHEERILHLKVTEILNNTEQPLNKDVNIVIDKIVGLVKLSQINSNIKCSFKERMGIFATLMQFTMYIPDIRPYYFADYQDIIKLHNLICSSGTHKTLDIDEQFALALKIEPQTINAIWLLFATSRQYARWYDTEAIIGMPDISNNTAINMMSKWYISLSAFKNKLPKTSQDVAGDTYYVWTHVVAKLIFGLYSPWWALDAKFYYLALHYGTWLNHNIAHKISPQSLKSDHTIAANYGNKIGKAIINNLQHINK